MYSHFKYRFLYLVVLLLLIFIVSYAFADNSEIFDKYFGYRKISTEPSGFFRIEKINNRFYLVTPEGNIFISIGINDATPTGDYCPKLGYSPYANAVKEIYGTQDKWLKVTMNRLKEWGFNTIGAWCWSELFKEKIPYTIIMNISHQDWQKGTIADFFDENWKTKIYKDVENICAKNADDPYLIGYFIDNELKWGPDWRGSQSIFSIYLSLPSDAQGKKNLVAFLKNKYKNISSFNNIYNSTFNTFEELSGIKGLTKKISEDEKEFLGIVAEEFYKTTTNAIRKYDKNHLILGDRFHSMGVPYEVVKAAGKYLDVISINYYTMGSMEKQIAKVAGTVSLDNFMENYYQITGKPILISEFSFKALDSGLPNTKCAGFPNLKTQTDRADKFEKYVRTAMKKSYIVGYHWFEYTDEPRLGRFDGENCNLGIVNEKDEPYEVLVDRMKKMNTNVYDIIAHSE